jgi:non-ribosomal peptide synthetase component F
MGMFVNTLAIRNYPSGDKTFLEFLSEVKSNSLKAFDNQDYQFDELVSRLGLRRDPGRNILFDTMFAMMKADGISGDRKVKDLTFKPYEYKHQATPFDILFYALEGGSWHKHEGIRFILMYSTTLFKKETAERLVRHFSNITEEITANPVIKISAIKMFTPGEKDFFFKSSRDKIGKLEIDFDF